jgi:8-oxo-dGTP pyrophosphatase MutT (NUDIX family)
MMETRQVFGSLAAAQSKRRRILFCSQCGSKCEDRLLWGEVRSVCTTCGYADVVRPGAAVAVVVVEGPRVLLCKRSTIITWPGKWCLPAGAIEFDEDFLTAGLRETEEETGLKVEIESIITVVTNYWDVGSNTVVPVLLAHPIDGIPHPTPESDEVAWFDPEALPEEMCWEADRHIITRYFRNQLAGIPVDLSYTRLDLAETRPEPPPSSMYRALP